MKIGILTLPFNNNYGGYLQAYALITVLKNAGHEVEIIYRRHDKLSIPRQVVYFFKTLMKLILGRKHGPLFYDEEYYFSSRGHLIMPFVDKYIVPRTKPIYSAEKLKFFLKNRYDAVIVGSDQVWRPIYVPNIENFFLDVCDDKTRKISYAASFGTNNPEYTNEQKIKIKSLVENFDYISIREIGGLDVFKQFGWNFTNVKIVLDPTLLLSKEHYYRYIKIEQDKYISMYILDNNTRNNLLCRNISHILKIEKLSSIEVDNYLLPSIEDWLSNIYNAQFVITDSFHGTVFSILFNKPFIVFINENRGSERFESLLGLFNLKNRIYRGENIEDIVCENIDWNKVNEILCQYRKDSYQFIYEALS